MLGRLFLLFTVVLVLELYLLIQVGRHIGAGPTVVLVLVTGILGAVLAKAEGLRVIRQWQLSLAQGRLPEEGVLGGVLVLVGAVLLITPGVLTDVVGLGLLFAPTRRIASRLVRRWLEKRIREGTIQVISMRSGPFPPPPRPREEGRVVDAESERIDEPRADLPPRRDDDREP